MHQELISWRKKKLKKKKTGLWGGIKPGGTKTGQEKKSKGFRGDQNGGGVQFEGVLEKDPAS